MKNTLLILSLFISTVTFSQLKEAEVRALAEKGDPQELVTECSRMLMEDYYYHAEIFADKLLTIEPESANYNYRKGYIIMAGYNNFLGALPYLKKAEVSLNKNYDMYSAKEKSAPQDVLFHLARCYHANHQLELASEYYLKFIAQSNQKSPLINVAKLNMQQLIVARKNLDNPSKSRLKNLGTTINSVNPEYSPVISLDGSALYFTSRRMWATESNEEDKNPRTNEYPEDIYVSFLDVESNWETPIKLEFCKPEQNEATMAVSSDERRVYLYQDTQGNGDVFYSDFETNKFSEVENFNASEVNTKYWETHLHVSPDGQQMFFVSDRPGGFGGRDIYRIQKLGDGSWSKAQNLGESVNTKYDEESPFVSIDNKTLYYSSNGDKSMGGFDVFISVRDEQNKWSNGINLGSPMNSCGDDLFYTTTVDGLTGYLTSWRVDGQGNKDIYEIKNDYLGLKNIAVLKGEIVTVGNVPLPEDVAITINCKNCGDEISRTVFPRLRDGSFFSSLEPCREYELIFHYTGGKKEFYRETIETSCDKEYQEIVRRIILDVEKMEVIPELPVAVVDTVKPPKMEELEYKNTFGYDENDKNFKRGNLLKFVADVEAQLKAGRPTITLMIYSSASKVTTKKFANNQALAESRANNMMVEVSKLIAKNPALAAKVKIEIADASVNGPDYIFGSRNEKEKYYPFQYVMIKTK